jgi:hypothetical protein
MEGPVLPTLLRPSRDPLEFCQGFPGLWTRPSSTGTDTRPEEFFWPNRAGAISNQGGRVVSSCAFALLRSLDFANAHRHSSMLDALVA